MKDKLKANQRFQNILEVLKQFGFQGKGWQQAVWPIPNQTNRYVWFAHLGEYAHGLNSMSEDAKHFTDRRDQKAPGADNYWNHVPEDVEYLLFVRTTHLGRRVVQFAGVFVPDREKSFQNVSAWKRVSDQCSLPDGSWCQPDNSN